MLSRLRQLLKRGHGEEGAAAVEFALILPLLILLVLGGMDLGHAYYLKHLITTASREGARYGSQYHVNPSTMLPYVPNALPTSISDYVKLAPPTGLGYAGLFASDANLTVTPRGPGIPVTPLALFSRSRLPLTSIGGYLAAENLMWHIQLPGFPNPQTFTATTAMTLER